MCAKLQLNIINKHLEIKMFAKLATALLCILQFLQENNVGNSNYNI